MPDVAIEPIDAANWHEAVDVRVADAQVAFVADHQPVALVILAKCFLCPDGRRWEPFLARDREGESVGVFALTHADETSELRHLAIDVSVQGRGVGTAVVRAIVDRLRDGEAGCKEFVVTAHPDNHAAHAAYRSAGLEPNGQRGIEPIWHIAFE